MNASDRLLELLKGRLYPNCTLYLIWHYVSVGDLETAAVEFRTDYDKLGSVRDTVAMILQEAK